MDDDLVEYVYCVCCVLSEEIPSGTGSDILIGVLDSSSRPIKLISVPDHIVPWSSSRQCYHVYVLLSNSVVGPCHLACILLAVWFLRFFVVDISTLPISSLVHWFVLLTIVLICPFPSCRSCRGNRPPHSNSPSRLDANPWLHHRGSRSEYREWCRILTLRYSSRPAESMVLLS